MRIHSRMLIIVLFVLVVMMLGPITVRGDEESIDALARPKVFISIEELKAYLDDIKNYYNMNGKGRYGKRDGKTRHFVDSPVYPENFLRSIIRNALKANDRFGDINSAETGSQTFEQRLEHPQVHELPNNN